MLRAPQMSDYAEWAALREASRDFLTPWEPTWPADDLTRASFRRRIKRYSEDQRGDLAYAFFVFRKPDNVLVGGLTLANIRRGCAQAGSLGYWMGARLCAPGPHDGGGERRHSVRVRHAAAAPGRGRLHPRQRRVDPAAGKDRLHSARALPGSISASTGSGRTTCCIARLKDDPRALTEAGDPALGPPRFRCYKARGGGLVGKVE